MMAYWHKYFSNRCEICGKYISVSALGVSWSQNWSYDMGGTPDLHDATYRCSPCTDKRGIKPTNCNEANGNKYHGRNESVSPQRQDNKQNEKEK